MAKHNEQTSVVPAVLVLLGVVGVGASIAYTMSTTQAAETQLANQSIDLERATKDTTLQQQGELVAPASWSDKAKGTAALPVERAMAMVVKSLNDDPASATPPPPPPKVPDADAGADGAEVTAEGADGGEATTDAAETATDAAAPEPTEEKPAPPTTPAPKPPTTPAPKPPTAPEVPEAP